MSTEYDLDQLRRKLGSLEAELAVARQQLARLEAASAQPPAVAPEPPPAPRPPVRPAPALAEPPLLPPVAPSAPVAPSPAASGGVRVWLAGIGLWPPGGDANTEARLGAWWATRLGALLAVIGVVFFGVYVSRNTPPPVKLAELGAVALVVFLAGLRLERMVPRFGPVVVAAGLALLYFTAFAAHAVPATRVLEEATTAAAVQWVVAGLILGFAAWRRSEPIAGMAVGLGYATAFFARYAGLDALSLWSGLALAAAAVGLKFIPGWRSPSLIALPLTYLIYTVTGRAMAAPSPLDIWLPLLAAFALFLLRDGPGAWLGRRPLTRDDRLLQNLNSSAAIAAGFLVTAHVQSGELTAFWFWSGGLMVVVAAGWWRAGPTGSLVPVAACKAAGLIALGLITHYDGHLRWLVLLVQAFVLLVAARVTAHRALRVMMVIVWAVSLLLFAWALASGRPVPTGGTLVYLVFSALLLTFDESWLRAHRGFSLPAGALLGITAGYAVDALAPAGWGPACFMALATFMAAAGGATRGWRAPAVSAGFLVIGAHLAMLAFDAHAHPAWWLWANEGILLAGVLAMGAALSRFAPVNDEPGVWRPVRALLAGGAVVVLTAVLFKGLARGEALAAAAGLGVGLLALAPRARHWPLVVTGTLALATGWLLHQPLRVSPPDQWLLAATAGAWALPVMLQLSPRRRDTVADPVHRRWLSLAQVVLATWITLLGLRANFAGPLLIAAVAAEAFAVFALAWQIGLRPALPAASAVLLAGAWWTASALTGHAAWILRAGGPAVATVVLLAAVGLALPVLARRGPAAAAAGWRRWALWGHGAGGLALLFWFFAVQRGPLAPYATVLWGGAAIVLFAAGLFARERVYRLTGLAGLALCIPRVFLVDLDSTLYRIVAFVVLGLVLLWVGFSYHRFRHLLAAADEPAGPPKAS